MSGVAVIYLDRYGNDVRLAREFLRSLIENEAGIDFQLVWQSKGYPNNKSNQDLEAVRASLPFPTIEMRFSDHEYQFSMAIEAVRWIDCEYFLFFTSSSRVLAPHWLSFYLNGFAQRQDCGMISASGSFEATPESSNFPNVHLRTNAFMIPRERMLQLRFGPLRTLADGNLVEAGPDNLTKQINAAGQQTFVVDRNGRLVTFKEWPKSNTFRSGYQGLLLVADNRTFDYHISAIARRTYLARLAWGAEASAQSSSDAERFDLAYDWMSFEKTTLDKRLSSMLHCHITKQ